MAGRLGFSTRRSALNSRSIPDPPMEKKQQKSVIYLGFYVAFNTVQVISRQVVGRAEETSTYSWSRFCTVNCRPTESNYQLSHLRPSWEPNPGLKGGRRECYHSATMAPTGSVWNCGLIASKSGNDCELSGEV